MEYEFRWGKNRCAPEGYPLAKYKDKPCRVLVFGKMNSCLIEFKDGTKHIVSRNAIRKKK